MQETSDYAVQHDAPAVVRQFVRGLTWHESPTFFRGLRCTYLKKTAERVSHLTREGYQDLLDVVDMLAVSARIAWLLSPSVSLVHYVSSASGTDLLYHLSSEVESYLREGRCERCYRHDSFSENLNATVCVTAEIDGCREQEYIVPGRTPLRPAGTEDEQPGAELLGRVMLLISTISPSAAVFCRAFTSRVAMRLSDSAGWSSASYRDAIGLTVLVSQEFRDVPVFRVADSLVHEAIHSGIHAMESIYGDFVEEGSDISIDSPWTGRRLSLDQYVHACFVWFGLLHFWSLSHSCVGTHAIDWENERVGVGFKGDPTKALMVPHIRRRISVACIAGLEEIRRRLTAA